MLKNLFLTLIFYSYFAIVIKFKNFSSKDKQICNLNGPSFVFLINFSWFNTHLLTVYITKLMVTVYYLINKIEHRIYVKLHSM